METVEAVRREVGIGDIRGGLLPEGKVEVIGALETADIALMGDDLSRLPDLYILSKRARRVIRQHIGNGGNTRRTSEARPVREAHAIF